MVGVHPALRFRLQHPVIGLQARGIFVHVHRAAAVGDVDALRAVAFHQQRLLRERFGRRHVAHHQEARDVHAKVAGGLDMLFRDVRLGAMGSDAHRFHAHFAGVLQIVDRTDAGQQQRGEHAVFEHFGDCADPVPVGIGAEAIVEAGALKAVAMRHFDGIDLRQIERLRDLAHVIEAVLVPDGVHAITQGDVLDVELLSGRIPQSHFSAHAAILIAIFSAVLSAAEVMMSKLPA